MKSNMLIQVLLVFYSCTSIAVHGSSLSYDPEDYLEVYPDPTDPDVLQGRTPLHFMLMQGLEGQFGSGGAVAGVKVALDRINNDSSLLPGYTLHYTFGDSQCNRTESLRSFFSQITREPTKIAVIGSGCSIATEPTAEVSYFYNISQISCIATSPTLENRIRFPYYHQLITSEEQLAFAYFGIIKEFKWRRISVIVQNENLFVAAVSRLMQLFEDTDVEFFERRFTEIEDLEEDGQTAFNNNSRIFILSMYPANARALLCKAHELNLFLPRNLMLTIGWYSQFWWRIQDDGLNCSVADRERVLGNSLAFSNLEFLHQADDITTSTTTGITGEEFLSEEKTFLNQPPLNVSLFEYSQYCYDATWTLLYALKETLVDIGNPDTNAALARAYNVTPPFQLEDFTYGDRGLLDIIFDHISNTSFNGITGSVSFGDEGIRKLNVLTIFQYRNVTNDTDGTMHLDLVDVGNVEEQGDDDNFVFVYRMNESNSTIFQGLIPYDGRPEDELTSVHPAVTVIFVLLAFTGVVFTIVCLVFNFKYRKSKLIKLASSLLNNLIGIGAIVLYISTVTLVIPTTDQTFATCLCNITPWLTAVGYSLCYGTILAKMMRVYYIFNYPSLKKKGIQDWMLLLGVGAMVAIDLLILIIYTAVEGSRGNLDAIRVPHLERHRITRGELGIIVQYFIYICDSTSRDIFLGILYGYKMTLQIVALVLAFSIRKVKVKGLDDSKYIAAAIYITSIVLAVIIVLTYSLKGYINIFAIVFSTGFIGGTTVILLLVFVPLMLRLYRDPDGERIFSKATGTDPLNLSLNGRASNVVDKESLQQRVKELESRLDSITRESVFVESQSYATKERPSLLERSSIAIMDNSVRLESYVDNSSKDIIPHQNGNGLTQV